MSNGPLSATNPINVGSGMPLIMRRTSCWLMCSVSAQDEVFKELKALLDPFGISRYYTDDWGAYDAPSWMLTT